ncbi:lipase-like domain-containing protein [Staphylococcus aureus]
MKKNGEKRWFSIRYFSRHPFNQAYTNATDKIQKGIWQVTPTKHDWDDVDFVGKDSSDTVRTREELQDFWHR